MPPTDDLYAVPPDEFVAARNALAKQLKAEGDTAGAAQVAKLRRPSVGAWALNQVARSQPDLIDAALDAGEELRQASEAAASGDAGALRAATAAERVAAQTVAKAARPHLGSRGDALVPALLATLRAAALDGDVAEQLRTGTLATEHEQAGFGFGLEGGDEPVAPRRATKPKSNATKGARPKLTAVPDLPEPDPEAAAREKAERAEARAAERQRKKDLTAAQRNATRLEREATRLAREADEAEADARAARDRADEAAERASAAQEAVAALEGSAGDR